MFIFLNCSTLLLKLKPVHLMRFYNELETEILRILKIDLSMESRHTLLLFSTTTNYSVLFP